jgi:hypothetical protein
MMSREVDSMRRKLKNFKNKNGHSENGAPRQLVDEALYREHAAKIDGDVVVKHYDPTYSGLTNASRPRDTAISLRTRGEVGG